MNDNEDVKAYMLQVNEVINAFRKIGEKIEDNFIVKKVLISLPLTFIPKFLL